MNLINKKNWKLFSAVAVLSGTVIGAGFLGIPYVVAKSGFIIGFLWMIIICFIMMFVNLLLGEIILSSKTFHHIPGYASKYLGEKTKMFVFFASIFGLYAALTAYLLGEGESLSFIFTGSLKYSFLAGILFWILMAIFTFKGIKSFKRIEPLAVLIVFFVVTIIGILDFSKINLANLAHINFSFAFLPFGVILFAFLGVSAIPEIRRILNRDKILMKKAIIIGSLIPLFVYILFTLLVLGLHGSQVQEIATLSLGKFVVLLGIFTMFTAFLALNLALQDTYRFDFNFSLRKAWIFSSLLPFAFFFIIKLFSLAGFVKILSLGGVVSGGLLGIAIILIHSHLKTKKLHRKPEFSINVPLTLKILIILLFILGIVYEFLI